MQALAADDESVAINLLQHKGTAQAEELILHHGMAWHGVDSHALPDARSKRLRTAPGRPTMWRKWWMLRWLSRCLLQACILALRGHAKAS